MSQEFREELLRSISRREEHKTTVPSLFVLHPLHAAAALQNTLGEIPILCAFRFAASRRFPGTVGRSRVIAGP